MTKEALITNLGTIARSGTSEFLDKLGEDGSEEGGNLIGQVSCHHYSKLTSSQTSNSLSLSFVVVVFLVWIRILLFFPSSGQSYSSL